MTSSRLDDAPSPPLRTQRARTQNAASEIAALSRATHPRPPSSSPPSQARTFPPRTPRRSFDDNPPTRRASTSFREDDEPDRPSRPFRSPRPPKPSSANRTGANPLTRSRFGANSKESELADSDDPLDPQNMHPLTLLEEHYADQFTVSPHDLSGHADVLQATDLAHADIDAALGVLETAQKSGDRVAIVDAEIKLTEADESIKYALELMVETKEKVYPPHEPGELDMSRFFKGSTGNVAVGTGGTGNAVEDSLRFLGEREGHYWRDTQALARRVIAGDFVKFTSRTERDEVQTMLKSIQATQSEAEGGQSRGEVVQFKPLDMGARDLVAERLVAGRGVDLADAGLVSSVEKEAARLVNGRWPARAKGVMLQTLREHLPASMGGSGGGGGGGGGKQRQRSVA